MGRGGWVWECMIKVLSNVVSCSSTCNSSHINSSLSQCLEVTSSHQSSFVSFNLYLLLPHVSEFVIDDACFFLSPMFSWMFSTPFIE